MPLATSASHPPDHDVNFHDLLRKMDQDFAGHLAHPIEKFRFHLNETIYDVRRIDQPDKARFIISTIMGYLPFSIESVERRDAIRRIVEAARTLPNVRFSIDSSSKIVVAGFFDIGVIAPDFMFYPVTLFLQEARPFMHLIGQYLQASKDD